MKIAVLPGDGIGPEIVAQAVNVLEALRSDGLKIELEHFLNALDARSIVDAANAFFGELEDFFRAWRPPVTAAPATNNPPSPVAASEPGRGSGKSPAASA